jgi:hypothetical protein
MGFISKSTVARDYRNSLKFTSLYLCLNLQSLVVNEGN